MCIIQRHIYIGTRTRRTSYAFWDRTDGGRRVGGEGWKKKLKNRIDTACVTSACVCTRGQQWRVYSHWTRIITRVYGVCCRCCLWLYRGRGYNGSYFLTRLCSVNHVIVRTNLVYAYICTVNARYVKSQREQKWSSRCRKIRDNKFH